MDREVIMEQWDAWRKYITEGGRGSWPRDAFESLLDCFEEEVEIFRRLLWLNHGHTGMYGDDGEMQCAECMTEYGFWDWKRTPVIEIESKIIEANLKKTVKGKS